MGVTGAHGFPCCGQKSVETVDIRDDLNPNHFQSQMIKEEDEMELEAELLEQESPPKVNLDPDPDAGSCSCPGPVPDLELVTLLKSELHPALNPEVEVDKWKVSDGNEDPKKLEYRIEPVNPYTEGLPLLQNFRPWSMNSNTSYMSSPEESQVFTEHRSIRVQTSKHLFWANKLIQASEHSLQKETNIYVKKNGGDKTTSHPGQNFIHTNTLSSKNQVRTTSAHSDHPATDSQVPPSTHLSSSNLSPAIGLAELINFASSLAIASSSKMNLPSLEHIIKAQSQKAEEPSTEPIQPSTEPVQPSTEPVQPAADKQELGKQEETPPEKPPEDGDPQKTWNQENKNLPRSYLDFSQPGTKRATIEGEVKLLQPPAISPQLQGARKEPGEEQLRR
ncbi:spermatogenesis-associated protein 32 isoform X2 [Nycticebus coucang]|uniref:spermatogenesis-associated protein 32 isoform X2 n=1 Tax=Nycticebus coucang TaxID=9470 RepID=UPI00234CDDB7|nr:spermatogenesis-associated protein 32 isoform X2 [Nycticebus coucang]